jgi:hypothetical protein
MGIRALFWGILASFGLIVSASAQVGHPAKGSWIGYWGPNAKTQHRLIMNLDWRNRAVVGQLNPGPKAINIVSANINYDTWMMTVEADMPASNGRNEKWVAVGKLENLGSWTNRVYSGTYTHGAEKGSFKVALH